MFTWSSNMGRDRSDTAHLQGAEKKNYEKQKVRMVGTGRFELPTPRTPSECSTRLSHVPTEDPLRRRMGFILNRFYTSQMSL